MTFDAQHSQDHTCQDGNILVVGNRCSNESRLIVLLTKLIALGFKYSFTQSLHQSLSHKADKTLSVVLVDVSKGSGIDARDLCVLIDNFTHCRVIAIDTEYNELTEKHVIEHGADDYFDHTTLSENQIYLKLSNNEAKPHLSYLPSTVSRHDDLTGLASEAKLCHTVDIALEHADLEQRSLALLSISIDEKRADDELVSITSTQLITAIARRLERNLRETDMAARRNNGDFSIMLRHLNAETDVSIVAEKLMELLQHPYIVEGKIIKTVSNIGIALPNVRHAQAGDLIADADQALKNSKQLGGNQFSFFGKKTNSAEALHLRSRLQSALLHDQFCLVYQPQVGISDGKIVAVEALLRWQLEPNHLLTPAQFMHHVEQSLHNSKVAQWVIERCCHQISQWSEDKLDNILVSLNLSHKQFIDPNLIITLQSALLRYDIDPKSLRLEVNEITLRNDAAKSKTIIDQLRGLGIQLAIDNFGADIGSLNTLSNFPVDQVKIDSSLIHSALEKPASHAIIDSMITTCHQLGISITAEAVETKDQLDYLKQANCDSYQGNLYSKPLTPNALLQQLKPA